MVKSFLGTILSICICLCLKAQHKSSLVDRIESYNRLLPKEKIYLTFDKPYYNAGDTIYFKSVLLNGSHNIDTLLSEKIYVELFNDSARLIERKVFVLNNGLGFGDFSLDKKLGHGSYTIRAYSNWQQNFGADYFFQKNFYVGNVKENRWLLETDQKLIDSGDKKMLHLRVKITNTNKEAVAFRDIEMHLRNNQKILMRANFQTARDGTISTDIPLLEKTLNSEYNFYIVDKTDKTKKLLLPVSVRELDKINLQYMPEGGAMVNGIHGQVAFKAIGSNGLGREIEGKIINDKNEVITNFKSFHRGMGSFYLLPKKNEKYIAIYAHNGKEVRENLPIAKEEGTALRIDHLSKPDSLLIYIKASESKKSDQDYQLVAQAGSHIVMSLSFNLKNGFANFKIAKINFPDGIIHFTLFSPEELPLNERQVFINYSKKINIKLETSEKSYEPRDSISLEILATREDGSPLRGTFALSVTDNRQIKQNDYEPNIISHFLLQSDLKGNIEDAGWYFANTEPAKLFAVDYLLLTQGWVGYHWDALEKTIKVPNFKSETATTIQGNVTSLTKRPLANLNLTLLSLGKNYLMMDTMTNFEGKFKYMNLPIIDTANYVIKARKTNGKTPSSNIYVDEFKPSSLLPTIKPVYPLYLNPNGAVVDFFKTGLKRITEVENRLTRLTGNLLKEVEIKGFRNDLLAEENWDASILKIINEEKLKKMPRKTLFDVMREELPGFTISRWWQSCDGPTTEHPMADFVVGTRHVSWIRIDKSKNIGPVPIEFFDYLLAEDIKHIAIYKGCASYYLDITTRTGDGLNRTYKPNGLYVYRPLVINVAKEFYSPRYNIDKLATIPDLRSTIFWEANVVTDENGKAKLSFYAADLPGSYTIKVEGTDLLGRFGYQKNTITITHKSVSK